MYGKKAGNLRQEQTKLQHELLDVDGRIQKARKGGEKKRVKLVATDKRKT